MRESTWTLVLLLLAVTGFVGLLTVWVVFFHPHISGAQYALFAIKHVQAFIGLPMAAVCSLVLVTVLRQRSGEGITFKVLGMSFTGPSGEVVLWIICFLVITVAIKAMW